MNPGELNCRVTLLAEVKTADGQGGLVVDHAAAQVILDFGEVTPERTIKFHFINGECITCRIPTMNKLPSNTKNSPPSGRP